MIVEKTHTLALYIHTSVHIIWLLINSISRFWRGVISNYISLHNSAKIIRTTRDNFCYTETNRYHITTKWDLTNISLLVWWSELINDYWQQEVEDLNPTNFIAGKLLLHIFFFLGYYKALNCFTANFAKPDLAKSTNWYSSLSHINISKLWDIGYIII